MSRIEERLDQIMNRRVCVDDQYAKVFSNGFKIGEKPCVEIKVQKEQGETTVDIQGDEVVLKTNEMDNDAKRLLKSAMEYYGHAPFGLKTYTPSLLTINSISNVQVTIFYESAPKSSDLSTKIENQLKSLLVDKLGVITSPQILISERITNSNLLKDPQTVDGDLLMSYLSESREISQYITESFESTMLKYQQERKYLNLVFFVSSNKAMKIYD